MSIKPVLHLLLLDMEYLNTILVFLIATIISSVIWFDCTYYCTHESTKNDFLCTGYQQNAYRLRHLNNGQTQGMSNYSDYLNEQYSTKAWSKRFLNGVDVQELHVVFASEESERARKLFKYDTISYGDNLNETYDIYGIDLPLDAPLFVYIHGGYWQKFNKSISAYGVGPLVTAGMKVIVLEYDLCPTVTLSELVEQVAKFGEFILKNSDYATSRRIIVAGHSAGAHLILCMIDKLLNRLSNPLRIDSIYLISGVYDLSELQHTTVNRNNILSVNASNVDRLSPLKFEFTEWSKQNIDINIYIGQYDCPTFIRQSMELYLRFANGFRVDFHLVQDHDHFDIVEALSLKSYQITKDIIANNGGGDGSDSRYDSIKAVIGGILLFICLLLLLKSSKSTKLTKSTKSR